MRMCERYHAPASRGGRADVSKPTKMPVAVRALRLAGREGSYYPSLYFCSKFLALYTLHTYI